MIRKVIFDMDGLMLITETLRSQALSELLTCHGKEPVLNEWGCVHQVGQTGGIAKLKQQYNLPRPLWWLKLQYRPIYRQVVTRDARPLPGLYDVLEMFQQRNMSLAIASGSPLWVIRMITKQLEVQQHFGTLVSSRELKQGKPFPDIYLETARRLNVQPEQCLVLEDSGIGVTAAKAAGMSVIAVPNRFTAQDNFSQADLVLESLEQITWKMISSLA